MSITRTRARGSSHEALRGDLGVARGRSCSEGARRVRRAEPNRSGAPTHHKPHRAVRRRPRSSTTAGTRLGFRQRRLAPLGPPARSPLHHLNNRIAGHLTWNAPRRWTSRTASTDVAGVVDENVDAAVVIEHTG